MSLRAIRRRVLPVLFLLPTATLATQEQVVEVGVVPAGTLPGTEVRLTVTYATADPEDQPLTGLGLRLHWNAGELQLVGLEDTLAPDLLAEGTPEPDVADLDGDGATDTFLHLAWTALDASWPGPGSMPVALYTAVFMTAPTFDGTTAVAISASATAAGWAFDPRIGLVFADSFESGDASAWSSAIGLPPTALAAKAGAGAGPALTEILITMAGDHRSLTELDLPLLDIDGDDQLDVATDGLLVLRHLFGFTGQPLIADALGADATRTTAAAVEAFLADIEPALDIDLDGRRQALSDGVLIMRFLAGYQGQALVDAALAPGAQRTDPLDIAGFLDLLADPEGLGDTDGDGVADIDELAGFDILIDLDGLGICCLTTRTVTSDPVRVDTDDDGLDDLAERLFRTDPRRGDTDFDGLDDGVELDRYASAPASVDTDADSRGPTGTGVPNPQFFDGNELALFGTSPALDDTDGDAHTDFEEVNQNGTAPLVANVPRLAVELVGNVNIDLTYTSTVTNESRTLESTLVGTTDTTGQSTTDSTTSQWSIGASSTVTAGVEAGFPGGATASAEASATISGEYSEETTTSFTEESSQSVQNEFQASEETAVTESQEITGGTLGTGINIRNLGDVTFTLSDLGVTALLRDPADRQSFAAVATLIPQLPAEGFTLGPFNGETGVLEVADPDISTSLATSLLADPSGLHLDVATFALEDEQGRNFAFLAEVTNERTALLTIDFGNGDVERYRVATLVERNPDGSGAGIAMGKVLADVLGIPFATAPRTGSEDPEFPNRVELLTRVRDVATDIDPDPVAYRNSYWAVLSNDPELTGTAGVPFTTDFHDIVLRSGDTLSLTYVTDADRDGLSLREEFLHGTTDVPRDFDGDGAIDAEEEARTPDFDQDQLSDSVEVRTGWTVNVNGLLDRQVHPDPTRADTDAFDRDGDDVNDGDQLDDLEEFRGRDGCGPYDPADPDQPDPACLGAADSGDATDPTTPDTDRDGLNDRDDDNPLDSQNFPPVVAFDVTAFDENTGVLELSGSVVDGADGIATVTFDWGDGTPTCLGEGASCEPAPVDFGGFAVAHTYAISGSFVVRVTATDDRQPPGVPATSDPFEVPGSPFIVTVANDALAYYPFDFDARTDDVEDLAGHSTGPYDGTRSAIVGPARDRFDQAERAFCFENVDQINTCPEVDLPHLPFTVSFTVAFWISRGPNARGPIFELDEVLTIGLDDDRHVYLELFDGSGSSLLTVTDPSDTTACNTANTCASTTEPCAWSFYAFTVEDGSEVTARIYRAASGEDEVAEVASGNEVGTVGDSGAGIDIGGADSDCASSNTPRFMGRLDDVRFFDRALSPAQLDVLLTLEPSP